LDRGVLLAVSDGAGSRPRSGEGAKAAVDAVLTWGQTAAPEACRGTDLRAAFGAARAAIHAIARPSGAAPSDFACTLAIALIDAASVRFAQVGDSIAVTRKASGELQTVAAPSRNEYVNETTFLTDPTWEQDLRLTETPVDEIDALALSTDGLQFKILADVTAGIPFTPFFDDAFAWATTQEATSPSLLEFIDGLDDQTGDDKTMLLAVRARDLCAGKPTSSRPQTETRQVPPEHEEDPRPG
jgi:hypothetical protein